MLYGATPRPASSSGLASRHVLLQNGGRRALSTSSGGGGGIGGGATISVVGQAVSWVRHNPRVVAVLAGAVLVMYGFYRGSMHLMHFFFNVSDKEIFNIGFVTGAIALGVIGLAGAYTQRRITFHVDDVYRAALRQLRKEAVVKEKMGEVWRPTGFRGYKIESLEHAIGGSDRRARSSFLEAPSRRVQMIFMLKGLKGSGMVSLEAFKRAGDYHFSMLSLDTRGEHVFLQGDADIALFPEVDEILGAHSDRVKAQAGTR